MSSPGALNVSRETFEKLEHYVSLLRKWNPKINLVSRASLDAVWDRHIADSAQLARLAPQCARHWADLGSGGGFPGLVIAIMAAETGHLDQVTLVESDGRKAAFLRTVLRETEVSAKIENKRIENCAPLAADVLSARALADLSSLLGFAERHLKPDGVAIFPKGNSWEKELSEAQTKWRFAYQIDKSETEIGPVILSVRGISRV